MVKLAIHKVIGGGVLTWEELSEVLLDVETQINRRPLSYMEDDVELPVHQPDTRTTHSANWRSRPQTTHKILKVLQGQPLETVKKESTSESYESITT